MAEGLFDFSPAEVPTAERGSRKSKYVATVDAVYQYLQNNSNEQAVKLELGDVGMKSAVTSFRNAISKRHHDTLRLVQRGGSLYIKRR